ncbi:WD40 domain-containing protein [Sesbania bispinosa]|nr:WD40 domain-containing protein [Sesbania bispinosa]
MPLGYEMATKGAVVNGGAMRMGEDKGTYRGSTTVGDGSALASDARGDQETSRRFGFLKHNKNYLFILSVTLTPLDPPSLCNKHPRFDFRAFQSSFFAARRRDPVMECFPKMDLRKCKPSFGSTSVALFSVPNQVDEMARPLKNMGGVEIDVDIDLREVYFLIMHFLSDGPC